MSELWSEHIIHDKRGTVLKCKNCKTETVIHNPAKVELFLCPNCLWLYSKDNKYEKISSAKRTPITPLLALGSKGSLEDTEYTIVGCANKYEKRNKHARWSEYTLLDDKGNYAFLSESFGHWTFLKETVKPQNFELRCSTFKDDNGETFEQFTSYYQVTQTAIGEFPYDVIDVKNCFTTEYISPPKIFTHENNGNENTFFEGTYLSPFKIARAFDKSYIDLPKRYGIGSCEPFYLGINPKRFLTLSIAFFLLTLPFYIFLSNSKPKRDLCKVSMALTDSLRTQHSVSDPFTITGLSPTLVRVESSSSVDNDWIEADISLVNEISGEEKSFISGLEYYHGYDDEGSWSEGKSHRTDYISNVAPGTYHIEANLAGPSFGHYTNFNLTAHEDSSIGWNYAVLMLSLGVISVLLIIAGNSFENKRASL